MKYGIKGCGDINAPAFQSLTPNIKNLLLSIFTVGSAAGVNAQCTHEFFSNPDNQSAYIGDSLVYETPGPIDDEYDAMIVGLSNFDLYINNELVTQSEIILKGGDKVKFVAMSVGTDNIVEPAGGEVGSPECQSASLVFIEAMNQVLPINRKSINAEQLQDSVIVIGQSGSRANTDFTELEASATGQEFISTGERTVHENPNSNQEETFRYAMHTRDLLSKLGEKPTDGVYYFRLNNHDLDGANDISPITSIRIEALEIAQVSIYPNPVRDLLNISIGQEAVDIGDILIADLMGRIVIEAKNIINGDRINISQLPTGLYVVKAKDGLFSELIVKE